MEIIGLAGDWHGNADHGRSVIYSLAMQDVHHIEQLGDFGIWPGTNGRVYLKEMEDALGSAKSTVYITEGNHEDYNHINSIPIVDGLRKVSDHIYLRTRGQRWIMGGRSFVSLGGAPSIDFEHRTIGRSWWPEEMITEGEAFEVAEAGYADVMLAHDAPDGGTRSVQAIIDKPWRESGWSHRGLRYAKEGRTLMNIAYAGVRPMLFAHGHFHVWDDTGPQDPDSEIKVTRFLSLGADISPAGSVALLRLDDLAVSWDAETWK